MKTQYRLLSYTLGANTYGYGGERLLGIEQDREISKGDSCNTFIMNLPNHIGTHLECPNHFYNSGKKIYEYKMKDFIFSKPITLNCPKSPNELVSEDDIKKDYKRLKEADLLLLRTGFFRYRKTYKYGTENPGVAPEAARFIRKYLNNIKCVGIDTVSVSPYKNRELGRKTHRIFFKNNLKNEPVCLIEGMNLSGRLDNLKKVHVFPLFISDIDSSPCVALGILKNR